MRNKQGITIAALIIAIIGLSIGFAAFSNTLTIRSSASVNPDSTSMNVVWSSSSSSAETNAIVPTLQPSNVTNFTATSATIPGADYRTLNNVSASFTEPGQSVRYDLYVYNAGQYTAYLTNLTMGSKTCAAIENQEHPELEATPSLVEDACKGISISVTIGTETLSSSGFLDNQALAPRGSVNARVVITYAAGSAYVDGPMEVTFGDITFTASTVQGAAPENPWITRGLTSSNVVFGDTYSSSGHLDVTLRLDGGLNIDQNYSSETVDQYINDYHAMLVGENYMMINIGEKYQVYYFDGYGTMKIYYVSSSVATFEKTNAATILQEGIEHDTPEEYSVS